MRTITYWALIFLILTIPFEKLMTFGAQDTPTLTRYLGVFVAGVWVVAILVSDKFRKPRPFHLAVFLFVLWNVISLLWSHNLDRAINRTTTYLQLMVLVFMLWDILLTSDMVRVSLQAYVLGAYVSVSSTIYNFFMGVTAHKNIARYTATGFNENEISLVLALGIPMAWYLATFTLPGVYPRLLKFINFAYVPLATFAILLTASRGGLISAIPGFLFILLTFTRLSLTSRIGHFLLLVAALFMLQSFVPKTSYDRLAQADDEIAEGDLTGRVDIWEQGIDLFLENPFIGVGTGMYQYTIKLQRSAHNAYLELLVELGIAGFVLFLFVLLLAVYHAMSLPRWESRLCIAVILIWAISMTALSLQYRKPTWLILSLPVIVANTAKERGKEGLVGPAEESHPARTAHPLIPSPAIYTFGEQLRDESSS